MKSLIVVRAFALAIVLFPALSISAKGETIWITYRFWDFYDGDQPNNPLGLHYPSSPSSDREVAGSFSFSLPANDAFPHDPSLACYQSEGRVELQGAGKSFEFDGVARFHFTLLDTNTYFWMSIVGDTYGWGFELEEYPVHPPFADDKQENLYWLHNRSANGWFSLTGLNDSAAYSDRSTRFSSPTVTVVPEAGSVLWMVVVGLSTGAIAASLRGRQRRRRP